MLYVLNFQCNDNFTAVKSNVMKFFFDIPEPVPQHAHIGPTGKDYFC